PPQPSSPLFPYTTLFRSQGQASVAIDGVARQIGEGRIDDHQPSSWIKDKGERVAADGRDGGAGGEPPVRRDAIDIHRTAAVSLQDRKSTRLNSSHLGISY